LLQVIDWLLELPLRAQKQIDRELNEYEEGRRMPYVTRWERSGMRKAIRETLRTRFGEEDVQLMPAIAELNGAERFLAMDRIIINAETLAEVRRACAKDPAPKRKKNGKDRQKKE
jgi:hypothetical protein